MGPVDLVGGHGNEIRPQGLGLEGNLQKALDGVGVENGVGADPVGQLGHLGDGHDGADSLLTIITDTNTVSGREPAADPLP